VVTLQAPVALVARGVSARVSKAAQFGCPEAKPIRGDASWDYSVIQGVHDSVRLPFVVGKHTSRKQDCRNEHLIKRKFH